MRRTGREETLYWVYDYRIQAIEALNALGRGMGSAEALSTASTMLQSAATRLSDSAAGRRYRQFAMLLEAVSHLANWQKAVRSAELEADRYLQAARLLARDLAKEIDNEVGAEMLAAVAQGVAELSDVDDVPKAASLLLCVPLPLPVFAEARQPVSLGRAPTHEGKAPDVIVAFTSFLMDGLRFEDPHTVQPEMIHDLRVEAWISQWPEGAERLILEPISVEPTDSYQLPTFSFEKPDGNAPHAVSQCGRMVLKVPQAFLARPLEFTYRARFSPDPVKPKLFVQGQRDLRVQAFDPRRTPVSGYTQIDQRIVQIRNEARRVPAVADDELSDFLLLLTAVGRVAGQSLQDNLFPEAYSERQFQDRMKTLLRPDPLIGSELEEHPRAGGGITDLSFRGIRLELKVEGSHLVGIEDGDRFLPQTAQYVVGSDRRFGILGILDCSPKTEAPGSPANDIVLKVVPPPTGGRLPICISVVIVRLQDIPVLIVDDNATNRQFFDRVLKR